MKNPRRLSLLAFGLGCDVAILAWCFHLNFGASTQLFERLVSAERPE